MKTNCIICKTEVDNWDDAYPDKEVIHPLGGTVFKTYGHYGSSVFDPMDASYLEIVVCDKCLTDRLDYTYEWITDRYAAELAEYKKAQDELIAQLMADDESGIQTK